MSSNIFTFADNATYGQGEGFENISTRIIGQHKEAPGNVMQSGQQENESELQSNLYESAHDYAILEQNEEIVLVKSTIIATMYIMCLYDNIVNEDNCIKSN